MMKFPIFRYPTMTMDVEHDSKGEPHFVEARLLISKAQTQLLNFEDTWVRFECGDTEEVVDLLEVFKVYLQHRAQP